IAAGDTVFLRAGTYGTGAETITASVSGSSAAPVLVKPFPGERATLNLTELDITGSNVWYMNDSVTAPGLIEVTRTTPSSTLLANSDGTDLIRMAEAGDGVKLIHLVVHDAAGVGISPQSETADHEVYGCVVYNNGRSPFLAPTYGHGIYAHGTTTAGTTRKITNNILFDQIGYGIHCFADTGNLQNFLIQRNAGFSNGLGNGFDFLVGGQTSLANASVTFNRMVRSDGNPVATVGLCEDGDPGAAAATGTVTDNYFSGTVALGNWVSTTLSFQRNTCIGSANQSLKVLFPGAANFTGYTFGSNTYTAAVNGFGEFAVDINLATTSSETNYATLAAWTAASGLDSTSTFTQAANLGTKTFLEPSSYVAGRGHLLVHNPTSAATVAVDISSVVTLGHNYAVYDVYDLWGTPILTGTYPGGTVSVPMSGTGKTPPAVVSGGFTPTNAHPVIGAYVVLQTA